MIGISNFRIRINDKEIDGQINKVIKTVKEKYLDVIPLGKAMNDIKERILDRTESYIDAHRKRPPVPYKKHLIDVLRETSFVKKTAKYTYILSIGNETILDDKVPYWYVVNYGGNPWDEFAIDGKGKAFFGIFTDGPPVVGGQGNTWFEETGDEDGKIHMMRPKNPIPPMHYLQYMADQFQREIRKFKSTIKSKKSTK